ncbi:MAG TPA: FxSxx-COOH system tetratricopeptide repeat protein [Trebonia sp.]|nr:FxSxx-COOH system tetratricopeptide repeat protein [Trebonia sp.]
MAAVQAGLRSGDRGRVQALYGPGGVGKTQLATEYAHRFAADYDVVWWITAERVGLIGAQFAELAEELDCAPQRAALPDMQRAALAALRQRDRWLLVFDNAEDPHALSSLLPGGVGHVLITSRTNRWVEVAIAVEVDQLTRPESVALLQSRLPGLAATDADQLAEELGDLPLAVAQAGGYIADTGMPVNEYRNLLASQAGQLMNLGRPSSYPQSLAAVVQLSYDQLRANHPAAGDLAEICAFLAPEPVPLPWFTRDFAPVSGPLEEAASDPLAWRQAIAEVRRSLLVRLDQQGVVMHRLTQAIVRDYLTGGTKAAIAASAAAMVVANRPADSEAPSTWPEWARFLPHLLAINPATADTPEVKVIGCDAVWYLVRRGDHSNAHSLSEQLYRTWRDRSGADDPHTLLAAHALSYVLLEVGRPHEALRLEKDTLARRRRVLGPDHADTLRSASVLGLILSDSGDSRTGRELEEDTFARSRRVLGEDHPDTLRYANNLIGSRRDLGDLQAARTLAEDSLPRFRRVFGEDHPNTRACAGNLANTLSQLGFHDAALKLGSDIFERFREILGADHPTTLSAANNLSADLFDLGNYSAARELGEDTLTRRRRVLGEDHPDTLTSANNLAATLSAFGDHSAARDLDEDTLARRRRVLGEDHPDTLTSSRHLAIDLAKLKKA